jgi:hypothetical protein
MTIHPEHTGGKETLPTTSASCELDVVHKQNNNKDPQANLPHQKHTQNSGHTQTPNIETSKSVKQGQHLQQRKIQTQGSTTQNVITKS